MIYETKPEKERIELENDSLRVMILPRMGGRVISLFHKGKKFEAAQPGAMMQGDAADVESAACGFAPYAYRCRSCEAHMQYWVSGIKPL